jgi:hypothetical protein
MMEWDIRTIREWDICWAYIKEKIDMQGRATFIPLDMQGKANMHND